MRIARVLSLISATALAATGFASELENRQAVGDLIENILDAIKNAATCGACESVLTLAKGAAFLGDDVFVDVFSGICRLSGAQDDDVCDGVVELEGPVLAEILRNMDIGSKTSETLCNTVAGLCPFPAVDPPELSFPASPANTTRPRPGGKAPLKIIGYSDIHVDPFYVTGSGTDCKKPICCRDYGGEFSPNATDAPAGPNGDHACDTPKSLEASLYQAIRDTVPDAAFALFTGDIIDHAIWNTTQEQNTLDIRSAYSMMTGFGNVYGTIGNHEQHPTNVIQPNNVGDNASWLYNLLSGIWTKWVGDEAASQEADTGFYSSKVPNSKLRVISLNTNMYYKLNFWLYEKEMAMDPNGQFKWLIQELSDAEAAGDRVYIIGHMPMGGSDTLRDGSNGFDQIVNRYKDTIAAMFFGHTHKDEFQISYSDYSARSFEKAVAFSYVMPSLTPTDGMPSFRVYDVDPDTFAVLDSTTYIADMENPAFQTTGPAWTKYYSARETYGPLVASPPSAGEELTPAFWHNVTEVMKTNHEAFQGYWARRTRGYDVQACTGDCKSDEICQLQAGRAQDNCFEPSIGIGLGKKKRDVGTTHSHGQSNDAKHAGRDIFCGGSVMRDVFAAVKAT